MLIKNLYVSQTVSIRKLDTIASFHAVCITEMAVAQKWSTYSIKVNRKDGFTISKTIITFLSQKVIPSSAQSKSFEFEDNFFAPLFEDFLNFSEPLVDCALHFISVLTWYFPNNYLIWGYGGVKQQLSD